MKPIRELNKEKPWTGWLLFTLTALIVFILGLFASSIVERRSESMMLQQVKPIADWEPRNEVWGENYPREYETYLMTKDTTFFSKYAGNGHIDLLEKYPNMVILWAGYAFSRDYNQARGHYYSVQDVRKTLRTGVPQPATCWTCKSTDVPRLMSEMGIANFY